MPGCMEMVEGLVIQVRSASCHLQQADHVHHLWLLHEWYLLGLAQAAE